MTEEKKKNNSRNLEIRLDEATASGIYINFFMSNFTQTEFVLDAVNRLPGMPAGKVAQRMVIAPATAKRLAMVLTESVKEYEKRFGALNLPHPPKVEGVVH